MTAHAVVLLDYPPAVLNVLPPLVLRIVEERRRHVRAFGTHAAEQKSRQTVAPIFSQERPRHAQAILRLEQLRFAGVVDRRVAQLVFEEAAMVVPFLLFLLGMEIDRL